MNKIVLGTAQFGMDYGINNKRGKIPAPEAAAIIKNAFKQGVDILDTAYDYGASESVIGGIIKKTGLKIKVISKLPACSALSVCRIVEESLERLHCKSLYGYLVHSFEVYQKDKNIWQKLLSLKRSGKIRKIGFSLYYPASLYNIFQERLEMDIVQIPFNIFDQRFNAYLPELKKKKIEIYARSAFLQGLLFKKPHQLGGYFKPLRQKMEELNTLAQKLGIPLCALYLNFLQSNPFIDKIVVGVDSLKDFKEILLASSYLAKTKYTLEKLKGFAVNEEKLVLPFNWNNASPLRSKKKIIAVIQARTSSTRLPAKVLLDLEGKTVLERVIERVERAKCIDEVIVATTTDKADLKITQICSQRGIRVYCGSRDDVLDRYYQAARLLNPIHVVRITADCPVIDPEVIDKTIELHLSKKADYANNRGNIPYPDGEDVEVFTFAALKKAWQEARFASEREHVTPYIKKHSEFFTCVYLECFKNLAGKRWTLDREDDYALIKIFYRKLYKKDNFFGIKEILQLLKAHPEYEKINSGIEPDEGYAKSLSEDKILKVNYPN
jgi:spore coat polysaccharide biosynthesis protein SpsF (cytidylyltransferase family)/aryl-alcohol dehydrogenase-like predicted oxidoreductase